MKNTDGSPKIKTLRPETVEFISLYKKLKGTAFTNNAELSYILGFKSVASITEIINARQNIATDKLQIFKEKYRDFINTEIFVKNQSNGLAVSSLQERDDENPFVDLGNGQYIMVVPWIQEPAYAGYLSGFQDPEYIEELPKHSFVVNKQHKGKYVAVTVIGDSMYYDGDDKIKEGDTVTGREIQQHLWTSRFHIHRFKDYIIVHKEGILIKRIIKHDVENGVITCRSLNPDKESYPDFELNLSECKQIFNIVNVTSYR